MTTRVVLSALVVGVLSLLPLSITIKAAGDIFTAAYTAANIPDYNFGASSALATTASWSRAALSGGGYGGADALKLTQIYNNDGQFGGDFGWGNNLDTGADPGQGATRFFRFRVKWDTNPDFQCRDQGDGSDIPYCKIKLVIFGTSCTGGHCRVIVTSESAVPDNDTVKFYLAVDGGDFQVQTGFYASEDWLHIQVEADSATTVSSNDGNMKIWVNNDTYASPTTTSANIDLETGDGWDAVRVGAYVNQGLQADGAQNIIISHFEIATTFDSTWAGGVAAPSTAIRLRITP